MSMINEAVLKVVAWAEQVGGDDEGQGLAEYGLILALVAILCVTALTALRGGITGTLNQIAAKL